MIKLGYSTVRVVRNAMDHARHSLGVPGHPRRCKSWCPWNTGALGAHVKTFNAQRHKLSGANTPHFTCNLLMPVSKCSSQQTINAHHCRTLTIIRPSRLELRPRNIAPETSCRDVHTWNKHNQHQITCHTCKNQLLRTYLWINLIFCNLNFAYP